MENGNGKCETGVIFCVNFGFHFVTAAHLACQVAECPVVVVAPTLPQNRCRPLYPTTPDTPPLAWPAHPSDWPSDAPHRAVSLPPYLSVPPVCALLMDGDGHPEGWRLDRVSSRPV